MLQITDLCLSLPGGQRLFDDLCWQVATGDRVALVGSNGAGKTTLFRTIIGQVHGDSGTIQVAPANSTLGYLPQDLVELPDRRLMDYLKDQAGLSAVEVRLREVEARMAGVVFDEDLLTLHARVLAEYERLDGYAFESKAAKTLRGLGFRPGDEERHCSQFSGGWKMRVSLAALLLRRPDLILLDEPTNHLDTESMEWLEGWLSGYEGTILAISHDRTFMDKIVRAVAHLENGTLTFYRGNFSAYLAAHEARVEELARQTKRQKAEAAHLQSYVDRFRYNAGKATQAQSRLKRLERMEPIRPPEKERRVSMRFPLCHPSGRVVLRVEGLSKTYDRPVFSGLDFEILRDEKVALVGINGSGKSTLSRLVAGVEVPTDGCVELGHGVERAYFSQSSSENLNYDGTLWEEVAPLAPGWSEGEKRGLLGCFLFGDDDLDKPVAVLSGGEKSRLALAKMLMRPSNFLVLDEPTNHLDMATRELFQQALLAYQGTLLIVSHDRYFLNRLAARVLEIREGKLHDYHGNYDCFVETRARQLEAQTLVAVQPETSADSKDDRRAKRREEGERRNEVYRRKKRYVDDLAVLERTIEADEARQTVLEKVLCAPETLADGEALQRAMIEHAELVLRLENAMKRWETLMETIEAIEAGFEPPREGAHP